MLQLILIILFLFPFNYKAQDPVYQVAVFLNIDDIDFEKEELLDIQEEHLTYLKKLQENGELEVFGAFAKGGEFLLFNINTIEQVREIIKKDPAVNAGIFRDEYFKSNVRFGNTCDPVGSKYMQHNFVRYTSHITKYNIQHVPQLLKMHDDYIKAVSETGNVLSEGVFANSDGGFMIIKGDLSKEVIINDPTVAAGFTIPEIRDIWMQEGIFCQ
ncbi:MAG: YciI family protein [Candidatus Cyclobacteriaceae bacterium M2_1C_046]